MNSTGVLVSTLLSLSFATPVFAAEPCQTRDAMELMMVAGKISNGLVPASATSRNHAKKFLKNSTDVMSSTCAVQPTRSKTTTSLVVKTAGIDGGDAVWCESKTTIKRFRTFISEGYEDSYELRFVGDCG